MGASLQQACHFSQKPEERPGRYPEKHRNAGLFSEIFPSGTGIGGLREALKALRPKRKSHFGTPCRVSACRPPPLLKRHYARQALRPGKP
jgi:hypothetical protein